MGAKSPLPPTPNLNPGKYDLYVHQIHVARPLHDKQCPNMWLWKGQQQPWIEQSEELKSFMFQEVLATQCDSTVQYILLLLYPQVWASLRALNTVELQM